MVNIRMRHADYKYEAKPFRTFRDIVYHDLEPIESKDVGFFKKDMKIRKNIKKIDGLYTTMAQKT